MLDEPERIALRPGDPNEGRGVYGSSFKVNIDSILRLS